MTVMDFPSSPTNGQTTTDGRYYFDSSVGSSGAWRSTPLPVGGLPAGSIMAWGTNTPPANWLLADGSAVSRSLYSSLFAVIGTQYGAGDGTTTFNLPDLRGRVPVGRNGGTFGTLGATGGAETHTLTEAQMPSHTHTGTTSTNGSHTHNPTNQARSIGGWPNGPFPTVASSGYNDGQYMLLDYQGNHNHTFTSNATGSGQAHNNLQPYQVVNYIIKFSAGWTAGDSELATRLGVVETANATTNKSGLVPIIPSSIVTASGSASVDSAGNVTFTGTTAISLNGVFTSAYENYRILIGGNWISNVSGTGTGMRYRANGIDSSSNLYYGQGVYQQGGGTPQPSQWSGGASQHYLSNLYTAGYGITTIDLFSPNMPVRTHGADVQQSLASGTGVYSAHTTLHDVAQAYDGFTVLTMTTANMTGRLRVYGYR